MTTTTNNEGVQDSGAGARVAMPPLIGFSLWLHVALGLVLVIDPQAWPWLLAVFIADHAVLTFAGLWPRSRLLGENWTELPRHCAAHREIALTIDDGPDPEVTPQLLDLLDTHGVKATFFCIGERALRHPELCRDIVARGHAVENHSQRHRHNFSLLGPRGTARELRAAQDSLAAVTGCTPRFFRAPAGLRNPFLDAQLRKFGLTLAAWTRRGYDTRSGDVSTVLKRLLPGLRPGAILLVHDGHCARTAAGVPVVLTLLPELFRHARQAGLRFITLPEALQSNFDERQP